MDVLFAVTVFSNLLKYGIWYHSCVPIRFKKIWLSFIPCILYMTLIYSKILPDDLPVLFIVFICILSYLPIMECNWDEKMVNVIKALFLVTCMDEIAAGIILLFMNRELLTDEQNNILNLFITGIVILLILFKQFIQKKMLPLEVVITKKYFRIMSYVLVVLVGFSVFMTIGGLQLLSNKLTERIQKNFVYAISVFAFFGVACMEVGLLYLIEKSKTYKKEVQISNMLVRANRIMYEAVLEKNVQVRKINHDMDKQLVCLRELTCQGNMESVKKYIDELNKKIKRRDLKYYDVGNEIIDALLAYYFNMLDEGVAIKIRGGCQKKIDAKQLELCTIIGNILENAVEELQRGCGEYRSISVKIESGEVFVKITVENTIFETESMESMENKRAFTKKADKVNHGWGLENIQDAVQNSRGKFEYIVKDGKFIAIVLLRFVNN